MERSDDVSKMYINSIVAPTRPTPLSITMTSLPDRRGILLLLATVIITGALLFSFYLPSTTNLPLLCSTTTVQPSVPDSTEPDDAILHYATSTVTPQQTAAEIRISLDVLLSRRPCNFLVFGLGHDSRMWSAFNRGGHTLFLEEDPQWVADVLRGAPHLRAETVRYPTQLKDADDLLRTYRTEEDCLLPRAFVKGNRRCKLALADLPAEVYEKEWDLIMIDAPRGYFPEAPGRMSAIWTAAVMARNRKSDGHTDIFLHDVDRKVEKTFAFEFLCEKNRIGATGRLWHFRIPAAGDGPATGFC